MEKRAEKGEFVLFCYMRKRLVSYSHVRKYVLVSLRGTEIRDLLPERIYEKIDESFRNIVCVVVAKAQTTDAIHVGILNTSISKNVGKKQIKKLFTECSKNVNCSVKFIKGAGRLCSFLINEDPEPFVRGEYLTLAIVKELAQKYKNHKRLYIESVSFTETEEDPVNHLRRKWNYCSKLKVPQKKEESVLLKIINYIKFIKKYFFLRLKRWPVDCLFWIPKPYLFGWILSCWWGCSFGFTYPNIGFTYPNILDAQIFLIHFYDNFLFYNLRILDSDFLEIISLPVPPAPTTSVLASVADIPLSPGVLFIVGGAILVICFSVFFINRKAETRTTRQP